MKLPEEETKPAFRPKFVVPLCLGAFVLVALAGGRMLAEGAPLSLALFLAVPAAILVGLGVAYLIAIPHTVLWDEKFLVLIFALRRDRVAWGSVDWYRKFGVVWSVAEPNRVGLRVLTRYRSETGGRRIALLGISGDRHGDGHARSPFAADYVTPFDRYVPPGRGRPSDQQ
jgi:hypothetical protein